MRRILLIQPPIHDFAAFDLYLYPLGLVRLSETLMLAGYDVELIDALDRFTPVPRTPGLRQPTFRGDGCGHFHRAEIPPPAHLSHIPRRYNRFGIPSAMIRERMANGGRPAAVAVTCAMTYWYPGVKEIAELSRALWPDVPVLLGGAYALLCPDHARAHSGADWVQAERDLDSMFSFLEPSKGRISSGHRLPGERTSAAVRASTGCPRRCPYCASFHLDGAYRPRDILDVLGEIDLLVNDLGRRQIAFYDDALLENDHFPELVKGLMDRGLHERATFHCPNALSASGVTPEAARLLKHCNFRTIRIGFETADPALQKDLGGKATNRDLEDALVNLKGAGYATDEIGVYILAGLPDQSADSIEASIRFVHASGGLSRLAEYSPVPGTPIFDRAKEISALDLEEPLNHNKTLAPFRFPTLNIDDMRRLKNITRELNEGQLRSHGS